MNFMKFLHELCIFYIMSLLSISLVFAQSQPEACTVVDTAIEGVEVIQLYDKYIYTLFTPHIGREHEDAIISATTPNLTDTIDRLNDVLDTYQTTINSEQFDAQRITYIAKVKDISWIGIELSEADTAFIEAQNDRYVSARNNMNRQFNQSPNWNSNKTDQLLFLAFSPRVIAQATDPEAFHEIEIHPLEDEDLKKRTDDSANQELYLRRLLQRDPQITDAQYSQIIFLFNNMGLRLSTIPENVLELFLDGIGIQEGMTRSNIRKLREAHNNVVSLVPLRDAAVVQSVLDLQGNGILLFGSLHAHGIKQGLIEACQDVGTIDWILLMLRLRLYYLLGV